MVENGVKRLTIASSQRRRPLNCCIIIPFYCNGVDVRVSIASRWLQGERVRNVCAEKISRFHKASIIHNSLLRIPGFTYKRTIYHSKLKNRIRSLSFGVFFSTSLCVIQCRTEFDLIWGFKCVSVYFVDSNLSCRLSFESHQPSGYSRNEAKLKSGAITTGFRGLAP